MTLLALNDENQATFGYGTGTPAAPVVDYEQFHWRTWQNGQLGSDQSLDCCTPAGDLFGLPAYDITVIARLRASGQGYGSFSHQAVFPGSYPEVLSMYGTDVGSFELPNPPYLHLGERESDAAAVSPQGVIAGTGSDQVWANADYNEGQACSPGFVCRDGHYTLFDADGDYHHSTLGGNTTLVAATFLPFLVNDQGWAIGWNAGYHATELWNGQGLQVVGAGYGLEVPRALNNQGQVILSGWPTAASPREGCLWEHGTATVLASTLPRALGGQITNIQPFALSNQVSSTDATIHILATARDNGAEVTVVCTRDNAGTWSFAKVQVPEGVTISDYTTINASGVIAAIGHNGAESHHALLLVPMDIEPDPDYVAGGGGGTFNGVSPQDIDAGANEGKGAMVPSIIRGPVSGQKHFVSPKSTVANDYIALKSGLPKQLINLYEWVSAPQDSTVAVFSGDKLDLLVKRDTAQKIVVKLRNKATQQIVDSDVLNVWVVWATGSCKNQPSQPYFNHSRGRSADGSNLLGTAYISAGDRDFANYYKFSFQIQPQEIVDLGADIPDLTGLGDPALLPPAGRHIISNVSLTGGVYYKWDVSRKMQFIIRNPDGMPPAKMPAVAGALYNGQPIANSTPAPWPNDEITGNDDYEHSSQSNDPYHADTDPRYPLTHAVGHLVSVDAPVRVVLDDGHRSDGDHYVEDVRFTEFVRLQIGKTWYHISKDVNWYDIMKVRYHIDSFSRAWIDDPDNPSQMGVNP